MKIDLAAPVQVQVVPAPVSKLDVQFYYDGNSVVLSYGDAGPGQGMSRDIVDIKSQPTLQAALDGYIFARLGAKLGTPVTKTVEVAVAQGAEIPDVLKP